jgi:hypothetical protein
VLDGTKIHRLILRGSPVAPRIIMKVFEILRCSTHKQAEESKTGLKGQRRRIAEFRRQFDLPKGQEIVDIGKSAREHLQIKDGNLGKLLRRLEKNKNSKEQVTMIFPYSDRLTRAEFEDGVEVFLPISRLANIGFADLDVLVKRDDPKEVRSREIKRVIESFDENALQWRRLSKRMGDYHAEFRENWIAYAFNGGPRPRNNTTLAKAAWWYQKDADNPKHVRPCPKKSKIVKEIFQLYVDENLSMKKISELLNANSISNPSVYERKTGTSSIRAMEWTPDAVNNVLISESVIGQFTLTISEKINGKRKPRPFLLENGEPAVIPDMFESIISREQFSAAQKLLEINRKSRTGAPSRHTNVNALQGMLFEGYYLNPLCRGSRTRPNKRYQYFSTNRVRFANKTSLKTTIEECFERSFYHAYNIKNKIDCDAAAGWAAATENNSAADDILKLEHEIDNKKKANDNLATQIQKADDSKIASQFTVLIKQNNKSIEALELKLNDFRTRKTKAESSSMVSAFTKMAEFTTDKKVRNTMRRFLAETDHRVLVFQNGFQWDRKRYLKRFGEIDSVLGKESSWVSFDERTFKANPFNFIREYILYSVMFGGTDPNEAGFTKNLFREFLGEGDDLEISIPESERYNRNADAFFVCEIGESDFFAGCFRNNQKKESSLQYATIGKSLETVCVVRNPSRIYAPVIKKYPEIEKSNVIGMAGEPLEIKNPNYAHLRASAEMKLREVKGAA